MKVLKKIVAFFERKAEYWYFFISTFLILEIVNNSFLGLVIPKWVCAIVAIALIVVFTFYISVIYRLFRSKYRDYLNEKEKEILVRTEKLEEHICELNQNQNRVLDTYYSNIDIQFIKQNESFERLIKEHKQCVQDVTIKLFDILNSNHISQIEKMDSLSGLLSQSGNKLKELADIVAQDVKSTNALSIAIQQMNVSIKNDVESINKENSDNTESIIQEIKVYLQNNQEYYELLSQKISGINEVVSDVNEKIANQIEESLVRLEDVIAVESTTARNNNKQLIDNLEKQISDKINEAVLMEQQMLQIIDNESETIREIKTVVETTNAFINQENKKLQVDLWQRIEDVSKQISTSIEKNETFDSFNVERFNELKNLLAQNEQNTMSKIEILSVKTADLQADVIKLITQVLDKTEDSDEKINASYNRIFNQVSGFSNFMKSSLDKVLHELDVQKQAIENESSFFSLSIDNQFIQLDEIRKEIVEGSKFSQTHQIELRSKVDDLQRQILSLNVLTEVLKNISDASVDKPEAEKVQADRVEEIEDKETGVIVYNHYKNNKLVMSEMLINKKKTYDVEYASSGQIIKTRNYGQDGSIITELQFYPNGQVKKRIEEINKDGTKKTVATQFDENGNKKEE